MLKKGRQSLPELLGACNASLAAASRLLGSQQQHQQLSRQQLKQALLVLIQQNCVRTYLQPAEVRVTGVRPAVYLYEADLVQILQVIRCACRKRLQEHLQESMAGWAGWLSRYLQLLVPHAQCVGIPGLASPCLLHVLQQQGPAAVHMLDAP